jgi:hypothetical protein
LVKTLSYVQSHFNDKAKALTEDYQRIKVSNSKDDQYLKNSFNGITDFQLDYFLQVYIKKMNKCIMEPGEAIGAITAQSIG